MTLENLEARWPRLKGFAEVYHNDLLPALKALQKRRKTGTIMFWSGVVFSMLGIIAVEVAKSLTSNGHSEGWIYASFAILLIGGLVGLFGRNMKTSSTDEAKQLLIDKLSTVLGVRFSLSPHRLYGDQFEDLALVPGFDEATETDEVSGDFEGVDFVLQEAKLETIERTRTGRGTTGLAVSLVLTATKQGNRNTVFHGLLGAFEFHKSFSSLTIGRSDRGVLNKLSNVFVSGERVRLESPEFEDLFEVYSDDQVEARYLLTPAFMERMVELHRRFDGRVQFAFRKNQLLLSLSNYGAWMEPRGSSDKLTDEGYVAHLVEDLTLAHRIIDALKLDAKTKA